MMARTHRRRYTHDQVQKSLVERLESKGIYEHIIENLEYCVGNTYGETDVIGVTFSGNYHIYEVKSNNKKYHKAQAQMERHYTTHPDLNAKYIFYAPNKVKRIMF